VIHSQTKKDLIIELQSLQEHIRRIEEKINVCREESTGNNIKVRSPRLPLQANIEFVGDFDILDAEGMDISETGICFELSVPLTFDMRFVQDGEIVTKRAALIWVKQLENGRSRLGLHFVGSEHELVRRTDD
jgi:hypothetical protein